MDEAHTVTDCAFRSASAQARHSRPEGYRARMRRAAAPGLLIAISSAALAADGRAAPNRDCTTAFVTKWAVDKEAALNNPPQRPCWLHTAAGPVICYREGCVRAHVYLNGQ